jgi:hypothetical protein
LVAKLIVVVGYGFGDSHINKMLAQALRDDDDRRLLAIANCTDALKAGAEIRGKLDVSEPQVIVRVGTAKQFIQTANLRDELLGEIPKSADAPF